MTTVSKFYLHRTTTGVAGTLPGSGVSISATSPTKIASGVNRSMDGTISASAQTSQALTTNATTAAQPSLIVRFVSDPIAAQTISQQIIHVTCGANVSSTNSNLRLQTVLGIWRPSTGSSVGLIMDQTGGVTTVASTTQLAKDQTTPLDSTTAQTAADGDVLILEIWRDSAPQSMGTAYTNTVYYDGTVENSTTNNAAYLLFANPITMADTARAARRPQIVGNTAAIQRASNW